MNISAVLLHGLGRTPLSMAWLARRLRAAGVDARCFGYSATFERFAPCRARLQTRINALTPPYVLIGHSLGTVLIRSVLPELTVPPLACFLLTPPTVACRLARRFAPCRPYRWLTGEMGQLLASPAFMAALPTPSMPTTVYVGTRGWRGRFSPFADEVNDGILSVAETAFPETLPNIQRVEIHTAHSFVMNHKDLIHDIIAGIKEAESRDVV
ncbi:MAG: alpha/beta hydrolase [Burkholderiales bacterium]|jgi:hypothetical protein|nr:alpha/beta hydrolase [Burkholderiales bacterium]